MTGTFRERRRRIGVAGLAIGMLAAVVPLLSASPASADSPASQVTETVTASVGAQSNVAPNGPLTGLTNGQTVAVTVTQASTAADPISSIAAIRECENNAPITNTGDMGPSNTGFCLSSPLNGSSDNVKTNITKVSPSGSFITTTFRVGTGSSACSPSTPAPATRPTPITTCDGTNDCSLWLAIGHGSGNDLVHYNLQFLGNPGAPGVAAACSATGANVTLTAPANTGHSTIASYTVHANPTDGGTQPADVVVTAPATTGSFTTFQAFKSYDISATATNAGGLTGPASVPAGTTLGVKTCPSGPTNVQAVVAPGQVTVSWLYATTRPTPRATRSCSATTPPVTPPRPPRSRAAPRRARSSPASPPATTTSPRCGPPTPAATSPGLLDPRGRVRPAAQHAHHPDHHRPPKPAGALVLTQVCGAPDTAGTSPTTTGGGADPLFSQYPYLRRTRPRATRWRRTRRTATSTWARPS